MARLGAPGTGFSSMDPSQAVDTPAGLAARRRSSGGGRSSRRTPTYKTVKVDGNTIFINGKGFSVAPSLQANFIKQHTGGSGSSAQAAINQVKQNIAAAAAKARLNEAQVQQEYRRILDARARIISRGGRESIQNSTDWKTKDKLKITSWKVRGDKVVKVENLDKGTVKYQSYAVPRGGGSSRFVGGVIVGATPKTPKTVTVNLPTDFTKKVSVTLTDDVKRMLDNNKLSSAINNVKGTQQINATIKRDIQMGKVSNFLLDVADVISGGYITEKKINANQVVLNYRIIKFNDKYNGKELSESEYNKANAEQMFIESEQRKLNLRTDKLVSSKKNKVRNFYQSLSIQKTPRLTVQQQSDVIKARSENIKIQNQIKKNQPLINNKNKQLISKTKELSTIKDDSLISFIKRVKIKNQINTLQTDIARLKFEAPPKILAGTMPIIPASAIPSGISQVRFLGTQRAGKGGKIVTDLVFKTNKGIMGVARGVSTTVKGNTVSIVGGRFGRVTAKLMKGTRRFDKIKSFVGVEKSIVKSIKFTSDKIKKIAKFINNQKKSGLIKVIKTNIQGMQQAGIGKVATIKGKKFFHPFIRFPSGKVGTRLGKGIDLDDFASVSAILTKGDISAIVGKTITLKGRKSEFIGMIKSLSSTGSKVVLSGTDKQQYSKALQKLFSTVAAAVSKAEKSGRFATKSLVLAGAAASLSKSVPIIFSLKSVKTTLVKKQISVSRPSIKTKTVQRKISSVQRKNLTRQTSKQKVLQKQIVKQKQKIKQLSKSKSKQAQKMVNKMKQNLKMNQKQLSKQKLTQKLITRQMLRAPTTPKPVTLNKISKIPIILIPRLLKGFTVKKLSKKVPTYYVIEKVRGKFKKLYPKPLRAKDARDYAVWSIDNHLSKTAFFVPMGKAKKVVSPPKNIAGYYSKHRIKVRKYKIRYGKKKQMLNGFIEKRKYFQDQPLEKAQMKRLRRKAIRKSPKRTAPPKKKKVKMSASRRKQMLSNLKKARSKLKRIRYKK